MTTKIQCCFFSAIQGEIHSHDGPGFKHYVWSSNPDSTSLIGGLIQSDTRHLLTELRRQRVEGVACIIEGKAKNWSCRLEALGQEPSPNFVCAATKSGDLILVDVKKKQILPADTQLLMVAPRLGDESDLRQFLKLHDHIDINYRNFFIASPQLFTEELNYTPTNLISHRLDEIAEHLSELQKPRGLARLFHRKSPKPGNVSAADSRPANSPGMQQSAPAFGQSQLLIYGLLAVLLVLAFLLAFKAFSPKGMTGSGEEYESATSGTEAPAIFAKPGDPGAVSATVPVPTVSDQIQPTAPDDNAPVATNGKQSILEEN